eukprot:TRINITY_DN4283_c0_g1_i1.p1 TRINITY_DN4283_c0_g1~~TRINITY_DN4283_c0_g1_i1.p1  ORF type:complete len:658 (+),score=178.23 TRINITY_DN4283_c0_g1_i1:541-2514(+)
MSAGGEAARWPGGRQLPLPTPRMGMIAQGGSVGAAMAAQGVLVRHRGSGGPSPSPHQHHYMPPSPPPATEQRHIAMEQRHISTTPPPQQSCYTSAETPLGSPSGTGGKGGGFGSGGGGVNLDSTSSFSLTISRKRSRADLSSDAKDVPKRNWRDAQSHDFRAGGAHMGGQSTTGARRRTSAGELLGLLNRSAQSMRLGRWEEAMVEAIGPKFGQRGGAKWKFAVGTYMLEMKTYEECQAVIEKIKRAAAEHMAPKRARLQTPACDKMVGPLRIGACGAKGRGLLATRDVKLGEVLMVSEPLAVTDADPSQFTTIGLLTGRLVEAVADAVRSCPLELPRLLALDNGSGSHDDDNTPDIRLYSDNAFAEVESGRMRPGPNEYLYGQYYLPQITKVVEANRVQNRRDGSSSHIQRSTALYLLPSLINHSCLPNAAQVFVGNTLVITAARPIMAGEEVTIQYFDVLTTLEERQRMSGDAFTCACERCRFEARLSSLAEAFMAHAVNSIAPVWQRVTSPDRATAEPAARDQENRTLAIRTVCGVDKFINSLGVQPPQATWLRASLFKVTETVLRCFLCVDSVDRLVLKLLKYVVTVISSTCPASMDHAVWARQGWLAATELCGADGEETQTWRDALIHVGQLRYNNIPDFVWDGSADNDGCY